MYGLSNYTGMCDAGFFCTGGASSSAPSDNVTGGMCPSGSYCPQGTSVPKKCPPGTYSNILRNQKLADCLPCDPGMYCNGWGLTKPSGNCSEGFYCPSGQNTSMPNEFR